MDKKILFAEGKTYAYLYLMTAPFTYLVYKVGNIRYADDFVSLNIFIALSLWIYIKKIQPLVKEKAATGINILPLLLIAMAVLFSIKSVSLSSDIDSEVSSIESDMSQLKYDVSDIKDEIEELRYK